MEFRHKVVTIAPVQRNSFYRAMSFTVTVNDSQEQFDTQPGETILDAALRNNRIFPYGCRNGICGACKCNLLRGTVDYGHHEEFTLTEEEKGQGKLLICQAIPLENVTIDAVEVMAGRNIQIKMLPCRVNKMDRLADDVMRLNLALPKTQEFNFIPGQYIDLILKDGQRRSFSIANLPERTKEEGLELHIRLVPDGHFTPRVFHSMKERDLLRLEGPFGTYFLQTSPERPIIMVAGGTGFAPIKGLIESAIAAQEEYQIHLFWGVRDEKDLYLDSLSRTWASALPNFRYTPVLSESTSATWTGKTGFAHQAVLEAYEDFRPFDVYASGPPIMVDAIRDHLSQRGMLLEHFHFDSFEFAHEN